MIVKYRVGTKTLDLYSANKLASSENPFISVNPKIKAIALYTKKTENRITIAFSNLFMKLY